MEFLKDLSVYLILLIIVGTPSFFWVRWIMRSYKKKREDKFFIASLTYVLFISGWLVITFAPAKYFKHDASESAIAIYKYFTTCLLLSLFILFLYFLGWITSLNFRKWLIKKAGILISKTNIGWKRD